MGLYTQYLVHEYLDNLNSDYIFINLSGPNKGHPLKYNSVADLVKRISRKTVIDFILHQLRNTHAQVLINSSWNESYVQKRLGYANVQTTRQFYVHTSNEYMKKQYKKYLDMRKDENNGTKETTNNNQ